MKFEQPLCPKCGDILAGTVDLVPGVASVFTRSDHVDSKTTFDFAGETRMGWNGQQHIRNDKGEVLVACDGCSHQWYTKLEES